MKKIMIIFGTVLLMTVSCSEHDHRQLASEKNNTEQVEMKEQEAGTSVGPNELSLSDSAQQPVPAKIEELSAGAAVAGRQKMVNLDAASSMVPAGPSMAPPYAPGQWNRESYDAVKLNTFINCSNDSLSTFSIDVDTASYANVRRFITGGSLPPVGAVRTEELINYFHYDYKEPDENQRFSLTAEVGPSPYNNDYKLARIALKGRDILPEKLPPSNLVFLIDVSGSMRHPNKLPLLKKSLKLLARGLTSSDRVSIVVYAGSDRIVLQPTPGSEYETISKAIDQLQSGGATHGSQGIVTAYQLAHQVFIPRGNNRIILASDGDFNVGVTSRGELQKLIEEQRQKGIFLTVLGFGMGNYHDDTMEILADKGNGNYAYIDSLLEAKKVLVKEMSGTLFTLARDVKIQVEFNSALVGAYRLIGYENRALADEDFKDDSKDAGEIGVGHSVTALYELIPAGHINVPAVDQLKYKSVEPSPSNSNRELLTVKLRYKPEGEQSSKQISLSVEKTEKRLENTSDDFRFAAAVAGYGMLLQQSPYLGSFSWNKCLELVQQARGRDTEGYRAEFYKIVEMSQLLAEKG